jgi:hypothetical protein
MAREKWRTVPKKFVVRQVLRYRKRHYTKGDIPNHEVPKTTQACMALLKELSAGNLGCPYVSCELNTYLEQLPSGAIKYNWPDARSPLDVPTAKSCVLCSVLAASLQGQSRADVAELMGGITEEAVRQIEYGAMKKLSGNIRFGDVAYEYYEEEA